MTQKTHPRPGQIPPAGRPNARSGSNLPPEANRDRRPDGAGGTAGESDENLLNLFLPQLSKGCNATGF